VRTKSTPVSLLLAIACIGLTLLPEAAQALLAYDRHAILAGQVWRLWTGHLVHFSHTHALVDGVVLYAMASLAEREFGSRSLACAVALAALVISLVLLAFVPSMLEYRGSSGIAVLVAVMAVTSVWNDERNHAFVMLVAAAYTLKTLVDSLSLVSTSSVLPLGVSVAWQAHVCGAIAGAVAVCFLGRRRAL
jgi:rhomboid family GlyGly-CTERM serine protease